MIVLVEHEELPEETILVRTYSMFLGDALMSTAKVEQFITLDFQGTAVNHDEPRQAIVTLSMKAAMALMDGLGYGLAEQHRRLF